MRDAKDFLTLLALISLIILVTSVFGSDNAVTGNAAKYTNYPGGTTWGSPVGQFGENDGGPARRAQQESTMPSFEKRCTEGSMMCSGRDLYRCVDGSYTYHETCNEGCSQGRCDVPSEAGNTRCISNNYLQQYTQTKGWTNVKRCSVGCSDGRCTGDVACEDGATLCDGSILRVCESGQWLNKRECALGCNKGACLTEEKTVLDDVIEESRDEVMDEPVEEQPVVVVEEEKKPSFWEWLRNIFS